MSGFSMQGATAPTNHVLVRVQAFEYDSSAAALRGRSLPTARVPAFAAPASQMPRQTPQRTFSASSWQGSRCLLASVGDRATSAPRQTSVPVPVESLPTRKQSLLGEEVALERSLSSQPQQLLHPVRRQVHVAGAVVVPETPTPESSRPDQPPITLRPLAIPVQGRSSSNASLLESEELDVTTRHGRSPELSEPFAPDLEAMPSAGDVSTFQNGGHIPVDGIAKSVDINMNLADFETLKMGRCVPRAAETSATMKKASNTESRQEEFVGLPQFDCSAFVECDGDIYGDVSSPACLPSPGSFVPKALDSVVEWNMDMLRTSGLDDVVGRAVSEPAASMHAVVRLIEALQNQSELNESQAQEVFRLQTLVGDMDMKHAQSEHTLRERGRSLTRRTPANNVGATKRGRSFTRRFRCGKAVLDEDEVAVIRGGEKERAASRPRKRNWKRWLSRRPWQWQHLRLSRLAQVWKPPGSSGRGHAHDVQGQATTSSGRSAS